VLLSQLKKVLKARARSLLEELIEEERATGRGKVRSGTEEEPIDWEDLLQDVEDLSLYDMRVSM